MLARTSEMDEELIRKVADELTGENKLIYKKQPLKKPTFGKVFATYFRINFGANIASLIFIPLAVGIGIFFLFQFPENAVYALILFISAGVVLAALLALLLGAPIANMAKLKGFYSEKSCFSIYRDRFEFEYVYEDLTCIKLIYKIEDVMYAKEGRNDFFVKVRANGKQTGFIVAKEGLSEHALDKMRSMCI